MAQIATTIEQSKHLLELGLDPKTADMCWVKDYTGQWVLITDTQINVRSRLEGMYEYFGFQWQEHIALVPAWSLSALLEVMPKYIMKDGVECNIEFWTEGLAYSRWVIGYVGWSRQGQKHIKLVRTTFCKAVGQNLNTAAYEMVCWLLEQGLIKKGGNNE